MKTLHVALALQLCTIATLYGNSHEFINDSDIPIKVRVESQYPKWPWFNETINPHSRKTTKNFVKGAKIIQVGIYDANKNKIILSISTLPDSRNALMTQLPTTWRFFTEGNKGKALMMAREKDGHLFQKESVEDLP